MGIGEEIAKVAYELYEKRGKSHGCDLEDWLAAEKIVRERHASKTAAGAKLSKSAAVGTKMKAAAEGRTRTAAKSPSGRKAAGRKKTTEKSGR